MPLKRKTIIPSLVLLAVMVALLFCSKDYNPFADLTNAKVHVVSWSFANRDSVPLYSTGTLKLVVALHEDVDSFVLKVPGNRYWTDTAIRSGPSVADGGPFTFSISFYDTGLQSVTIETHRSNGEVVPQVFTVFVTNVLRQAGINGVFGKPFTLSTPAVADKDVFYHWDFGPGRRDSSLVNSRLKSFYYFAPSKGKGTLWATDLFGKNSTPLDSFTYSFIDTQPPIITCVDTIGLHGDTLRTGNSTLVFKVRIIDSGTEQIDSSSINGGPFDTWDSRDNVYTKIFDDLPALTPGSVPLQIKVFARDNPDFRNVATHTFWAVYDSGAARNSLVEISFVPNSAVAVSPARTYQVSGNVVNYSAVPQALKLRMFVNGKDKGIFDTLTDSAGKTGLWDGAVSLDTLPDIVTIRVDDVNGDSLAGASKTIVYNPNIKDTVPPLIYEILDSADGTGLGNSNDTNPVVYTAKSAMTLQIIAFDDGTGVQSAAINNIPLQRSNPDYIWYGHVAPIAHSAQGTKCLVSVTDYAGNVTRRTLTLIKNSPPVMVSMPAIPPVFCIDSTYSFTIMYSDQDGDPVTIVWRSKPGSMDTSMNGTISWRPATSDLGPDSIVIQASDGYSYSDRFVRTFTVVNCKQQYPVHFVTKAQDFPAVLQANRDTLSLRLKTDTVLPGLLFSARFLDRPEVIKQSDTSATLVWVPVLTDTGYRRLLVTVGNGDTTWDTINPVFWVVPKNQYPCSLSYTYTGPTTANGLLDLFSHPQPETLYFAIHDKDNLLTEKYTVSITQGGVNSVQVLNRLNFFIAIKPDSLLNIDTLRVSILDMTGTTDSAKFIIQYAGLRADRLPFVLTPPAFPAWCYVDSFYRDTIVPFDSDNDVVNVLTVHAPPGMTVSPKGIITWTPIAADTGADSLVVRLFDQKEYSANFRWPLTIVNLAAVPPGVKFLTKAGDFPSVMQAGVDSIAIGLRTVAGTGVRPFGFGARLMGYAAPLLTNDTAGLLKWKPAIADTGARVMLVTVKDRYNRADTITPAFTVVPRNQYPCSLSYVYSGTTVSPGIMQIAYLESPETFTFTIHDLDNPLTERYTVDIVKNQVHTTQTLAGATRNFTLTVSASAVTAVDTIRVKVSDLTGTADSVTMVIRYIGRYLLHLQLNTTALGAGVATNQVNFPVLVRLTKGNFDFSKALKNGQDIVCRKPDGTVLPHEVEQWDSLNGVAAVWVKADTVFGNDSAHFINLSAGEDLGTAQSNPSAVFDTANAFCGVWHLNENPAGGAGTIKDRTALGNNGTSYGTMTAADQVPGIIGNGMNFNGNNAYVSFGDINQVDGLTKLTASAWIKPSGLQDWTSIIGKAGDNVNEWDFKEAGTSGNSTSNNIQVATRNNGASNTMNGYTTTNPLSVGNWFFCVMVYDGTQMTSATRQRFYINGVQQMLRFDGNIPGQLPSTTWPVQIAWTPIATGWFQGILDEAIVARDARSADWIKLCYMNQKAVDALVKFR